MDNRRENPIQYDFNKNKISCCKQLHDFKYEFLTKNWIIGEKIRYNMIPIKIKWISHSKKMKH